MSWVRIAIMTGFQALAVAGVWMATWAYANWPSYKIEGLTVPEIARRIPTLAIGGPLFAGLLGVSLVLAAVLFLAVYLFRSEA